VDADVTFVGLSFGNGSGTHAYEIFPHAELAPSTTYFIRALPMGSTLRMESKFTTGAGPANPPLPAPPMISAQLSQTMVETGWSGGVLCLHAEGAPFVDVTVIDSASGAGGSRFIREGAEHGFYGVYAGEGSCIEVRARNLAGVRSSPVQLCPLAFFPPDGWWPACVNGRVFAQGPGGASWFADEGRPDAGAAGASGQPPDGGDPVATGGSTGVLDAAPPAKPGSDASNSDSASSCAIASPRAGSVGGLTLLVAAALAFVARALRS
jgi:hypothetical protein